MVIGKKDIQTGDVFEIPTSKGFGHFQAIKLVPKWGHWIKVFVGVTQAPVERAIDLISTEPQFFIYFPLRAAMKQKAVRHIGSLPVAAQESELPRMKSRGGVLPGGKVVDWWIIDGPTSWRVKNLSEAERRYPLETVVNDTGLSEMIDAGWRPELDPSLS